MPSGKEIRGKISSVKNTQKITGAMEMVAASKMRKAQDRMKSSRPYADKVSNVIHHLAQAHPEHKHPYLVNRDPNKGVGFIIISSDRGLCGGLNTNLFRPLLRSMQEWDKKSIPISMCTIGQKASVFFRRFGGKIIAQTTHIGDSPNIGDLIGSIKVMLDSYQKGNIDRLYLVFNRFVNTMTQQPVIEQLLPITTPKFDEKLDHRWDYLYEPEASRVLNQLLVRYIESLVYQGVVENVACEQAARMVAMKAASDNAGNLIDDLQLAYNKARQAMITQELSEIVGGAAAL
ncbi:F0F1 ATP synthase subunit gamma [Candidatus Nitrosacidococcus tergens]|uniref:ATP synthase gamma chain n=1 Tax=Candidatus Nitrosacidococcus tergens TaxID=553981 RepID=A0A7G1QBX9_9GAMM|nr:F0F1 ATP synthase subunit gamma [Candidatus Nitrosacidococcus tergens]CAB1277629.1 F1 sector of membrane-bound ATP synthase, gamma subunit [Candidatus Nitrosacidococcus tergens]